MGQNKRFPHLLEGDIARVSERMERRPSPYGLSEPELRASGMRRDAREPTPVTAWIPHRITYEEPQLVDGEAIAWTNRGVLVRWTSAESTYPHHTWVWASSVTRRRADRG